MDNDRAHHDAVGTAPILTPDEAHIDRAVRTRKQASSCVALAMVTSPEIAADLIDRAIALARAAETRAGAGVEKKACV